MVSLVWCFLLWVSSGLMLVLRNWLRLVGLWVLKSVEYSVSLFWLMICFCMFRWVSIIRVCCSVV